MNNLILAIGLIFVSCPVFSQGLLVTDLESGTAQYPPVLEQVRARLIQENHAYSYFEGDLVLYLRVNSRSLCLEFSNSYAHDEMKKRIEAGLVSPEQSPLPSAIQVG